MEKKNDLSILFLFFFGALDFFHIRIYLRNMSY